MRAPRGASKVHLEVLVGALEALKRERQGGIISTNAHPQVGAYLQLGCKNMGSKQVRQQH